MRSVDALQTFYVLVFCIIRSWFELLVCMALFMGSPVDRNVLLCIRRYGVTLLDVLSGRRTDEFICMGHSTEEITAEQEPSADCFTGVYYAARQCFFSLPSYYTRTDTELIIQHLCRSD